MRKRPIPEINGVSYTAEAVLGEGGTAEVLKVRSSADEEAYALKKIVKAKKSVRNERFRNEIAFGKAATNDHVVKIHASAEDDGHFYYTMDLYPKSLRHVIDEESDPQVLLDYLSQLCDGLAYVHSEGVVHRDIKPENILVDGQTRHLVLADFGIAHFKDSRLTKSGEILANRNYQAPEQMAKKAPGDIGKAADVFALGLIITEVFTKENSRGTRHRKVGDVHPFLSDLDLLVESMTLQDQTRRINIQAARNELLRIRRLVESNIEDIQEFHPIFVPTGGSSTEGKLILERAATDILSAKYIFERTTDEELSQYNQNYHCEIGYRVSDELFNSCVQSKLYAICKEKFEYEGRSDWNASDMNSVVSPSKVRLLNEFESIQRQYPLDQDSIWAGLPRVAAHYFRFCKEYHCEEILQKIRQLLSVTPHQGDGSLHTNLVNAPIVWIIQNVRRYLATDRFEISPRNLQRIKFERHVSVYWDGTFLDDSTRRAAGADLFDRSLFAENVAHILEEFQKDRDVSVWERLDGNYMIYFHSHDEYKKFGKEALASVDPDPVFQADVRDLLKPEYEDEGLVALTWEPTFTIRNTLANVLKSHDPS
jgi:serine/threonine protein kinase